ncbi:cell wall hydrolase [Sulfurifustis variabilis]|uniref:Cell wall hydrolase n=1 Tax=Sulfurifustis variabilis TaxID=1675686 RepID=A0A1B4V2B0_9GAMM|nr:cell wall hydrolase [Sulfurifustis variabilis]BAU47643.1 cell wall hydrolase [Sulfurifustis variabilis]
MYRRRSRRTRAGRLASALSLWWSDLRFRWQAADKTPLVVVFLVGALAGGFGWLLQSLSADRVERQNLACLALNVYFEARGEPEAGQQAVAEVTMNRVASRHYPDTVCGVVYQKNWDPLRKRYVSAFSWTEFDTVPTPEGEEWDRALKVARDVYYQRHEPKLAGVLHYHATYVRPSWSRKKIPVAQIGNHRFYR